MISPTSHPGATAPICFIGDCHVGALRAAAASNPDGQIPREMVFAAAGADGLFETEVVDGFLRPLPGADKVRGHLELTTGGLEAVNLCNRQLIVLHGLRAPVSAIQLLFLRHRPFDLKSASHDDKGALVSEPLVESMLQGVWEKSLLKKVAEMVRGATGGAIAFVPTPLRAQPVDNSADDQQVADILYRYYLRSLRKVLDPLDIKLVPQPEQTRAPGLFTKREYASGGALLKADPTASRSEGDGVHMNSAFGLAVLEALRQEYAEVFSPH